MENNLQFLQPLEEQGFLIPRVGEWPNQRDLSMFKKISEKIKNFFNFEVDTTLVTRFSLKKEASTLEILLDGGLNTALSWPQIVKACSAHRSSLGDFPIGRPNLFFAKNKQEVTNKQEITPVLVYNMPGGLWAENRDLNNLKKFVLASELRVFLAQEAKPI